MITQPSEILKELQKIRDVEFQLSFRRLNHGKLDSIVLGFEADKRIIIQSAPYCEGDEEGWRICINANNTQKLKNEISLPKSLRLSEDVIQAVSCSESNGSSLYGISLPIIDRINILILCGNIIGSLAYFGPGAQRSDFDPGEAYDHLLRLS